MDANKKNALLQRRRLLYAERVGRAAEALIINENRPLDNYECRSPSIIPTSVILPIQCREIGPETSGNKHLNKFLGQNEKDQRNDTNEKKRKAYAEMDANKKNALLERRRLLYAERVGKNKEASTLNQNNPPHDFDAQQLPNIPIPIVSPIECGSIDPEVVRATNSTEILAEKRLLCSSNVVSTSRRAHVDEAMYPSVRFRGTRQNETSFLEQASANNTPSISMLPTVADCKHCSAKRFYREPPGFCCSEGEINIVASEMPAALAQLFTGSDREAIDFRKYIRSYNNNLAFITFSAKKDKELMKNHMGVYTFKVQGKIHHYLGSLERTRDAPSTLELYFYDADTQLEERMKLSECFSKVVMTKLIEILYENPYAKFLRQVKDLESPDNYQICLVSCPTLDQRVYNEPTCNDVSAILSSNSDKQFNPACHIQIYEKNALPHKICHYFGCYDPLQYPLLFPHGEVGWHSGIHKLPPNKSKRNYKCKVPLENLGNTVEDANQLIREEEAAAHEGARKRNTISCRQYYCYKLQKRPNDRSMLLHTGRLLQQYIVDMFVKVETSRLEYLEKQQKEIRTDSLRGLLDSIASGHTSTSEVGRKIILPPSFIGGPRDMKKRYMDAMCLVQNFGKPDFFLTMTCNSAWPEITEHLLPSELAQNRPDLLSRVFKAKLEMLKTDLLKDNIFGIPIAFVYSIEFQKRGLPHSHILLIVDKDSKPLNPDAYDRYISAELPDPIKYPHLHLLVVKHMVHGPCGPLNPKCPCMRDNKCKNKYPKEFAQYTTHGSNSYPHYRRRDTGINVRVRGHKIDNRSIVPYNPYLLQKYDCHINVEICSTIKLVKYIYKYIYKGPDKIAFRMSTTTSENEIREYQQGRWVGPPEAAWRLFSFDLFEMQPAVIALQLHLPDNYLVSFPTNEDLNNIVTNNFLSRTMLTQFFQMNKFNSTAMNLKLLYKDFLKHFVWDSGKRSWAERKRGKVVGRIVSVSPTEGERYYLRLLLNHLKGPTSFDDLLTVDGYLPCTFRESALQRNLLTTDYDLDKCLEEASMYQMPRQLRHLFVSILVFCSPSDPRKLWEKYMEPLSDDYLQGILSSSSITDARMKALFDIAMMLDDMGKKLDDYKLGPEAEAIAQQGTITKEIMFEKSLTVDETDLLNVHSLNEQQQYAFDQIMTKVISGEPGAFFIDGPGGTGKTFLYRTILATIRSKGHIALATASSGVAACVLPGGRTAHSRFKLPLQEEENKIANVSKQSTTARLLREAKIIIWDEAPMAHKESIEAFSEMLKDVTDTNMPFGNKIVVFGGDFRQVLPVVTNASRQQQLNASLVSSTLWPVLQKIHLTENIRAIEDPAFTEYLLRIGDGTEPEDENGNIRLPTNMLIPFYDKETSLKQLVQFVYPEIQAFAIQHNTVMNNALLAPTNECVDDINDAMLKQMPGEVITYISNDVAIDRYH